LELVGQPYNIQASWERPSNKVVAYHLWIISNGVNWEDRGGVSSTSTTLTGLTPMTLYYVKVYSRDTDGNESLVYTQENITTPPDI